MLVEDPTRRQRDVRRQRCAGVPAHWTIRISDVPSGCSTAARQRPRLVTSLRNWKKRAGWPAAVTDQDRPVNSLQRANVNTELLPSFTTSRHMLGPAAPL